MERDGMPCADKDEWKKRFAYVPTRVGSIKQPRSYENRTGYNPILHEPPASYYWIWWKYYEQQGNFWRNMRRPFEIPLHVDAIFSGWSHWVPDLYNLR